MITILLHLSMGQGHITIAGLENILWDDMRILGNDENEPGLLVSVKRRLNSLIIDRVPHLALLNPKLNNHKDYLKLAKLSRDNLEKFISSIPYDVRDIASTLSVHILGYYLPYLPKELLRCFESKAHNLVLAYMRNVDRNIESISEDWLVDPNIIEILQLSPGSDIASMLHEASKSIWDLWSEKDICELVHPTTYVKSIEFWKNPFIASSKCLACIKNISKNDEFALILPNLPANILEYMSQPVSEKVASKITVQQAKLFGTKIETINEMCKKLPIHLMNLNTVLNGVTPECFASYFNGLDSNFVYTEDTESSTSLKKLDNKTDLESSFSSNYYLSDNTFAHDDSTASSPKFKSVEEIKVAARKSLMNRHVTFSNEIILENDLEEIYQVKFEDRINIFTLSFIKNLPKDVKQRIGKFIHPVDKQFMGQWTIDALYGEDSIAFNIKDGGVFHPDILIDLRPDQLMHMQDITAVRDCILKVPDRLPDKIFAFVDAEFFVILKINISEDLFTKMRLSRAKRVFFYASSKLSSTRNLEKQKVLNHRERIHNFSTSGQQLEKNDTIFGDNQRLFKHEGINTHQINQVAKTDPYLASSDENGEAWDSQDCQKKEKGPTDWSGRHICSLFDDAEKYTAMERWILAGASPDCLKEIPISQFYEHLGSQERGRIPCDVLKNLPEQYFEDWSIERWKKLRINLSNLPVHVISSIPTKIIRSIGEATLIQSPLHLLNAEQLKVAMCEEVSRGYAHFSRLPPNSLTLLDAEQISLRHLNTMTPEQAKYIGSELSIEDKRCILTNMISLLKRPEIETILQKRKNELELDQMLVSKLT